MSRLQITSQNWKGMFQFWVHKLSTWVLYDFIHVVDLVAHLP